MISNEIHKYTSENVPDGYDTIVSYFMSNIDYAPETPQEVLTDEHFAECEIWCCHYADRLGLELPMVEAPEALKGLGVKFVRAYPEALLEMHMNACA
ncbi:hypothetical protein [Brucella anthropi]|uniref:Uncharacterized protein n=1 Tax=Brucella anthropi TaxID=529 RepID=A0A6L3Z4N4_BRUAN|nr:hypothetical protein [Brucella anthropi]KAB2767619.1 hypothetical protein F9L04_14950 [Brucella anthropi]UVV66948.1 hypothetical protein NW321_10725 [Brucella anthropi]